MTRLMYGAMAAGLLAVMAVACGGGSDDADDGAFDRAGVGGNTSARQDALAPSAGSRDAAPGAAESAVKAGGTSNSGAVPAAASVDRKVIFTATLVLEAQDVRAAFAAVEQAARGAAGYVERSSVGSTRDGAGREFMTATLTIRVPADRYDATVGAIRSLAGTTVEREDASSTEVTEEYTDLNSRLRNLERSEAQYLVLLGQAKTITDILVVNERIDSVRAQIEQIQGRLRLLDDLTDLATIAVSIHAPGGKPVPIDDGPKSFSQAFGDAWDAAVEAGEYVIAAGAVVLVAAIWLAVPLLVVIVPFAIARRRRGSPPAESPPAPTGATS